MLQPSHQARRPSSGAIPGSVGVASRLFPTSYVAPSVTAVAVAPNAVPPASSRGNSARDAVSKPKAASSSGSAPLSRSQSTSAFSRLYAHAVDLMEHKDEVFRHFGLRKEGDRRPPSGAVGVSARRTTATTQSQARSRSSDPSRRTSIVSSTTRRSSSATPRKSVRPGSHTHIYERSSSATCLASRRAPSAPVLAQTFSLQSTLVSRAAVSPYRRLPHDSSKRSVPKARGGAVSASRSYSKQRASAPRQGNGNQSSTARPTSKSRSTGPGGRQVGSKRRPSEREPAAAVAATITPTQRLLRRQSSYPALGVTALAPGGQQPALSTRAPQRKASVAGPMCSGGAKPAIPPPVMVEVSRRTSSPIFVAASAGEPGMKRRPSVARIPSASGGPFRAEDMQQGAALSQSLGPRASIIVRRDARLEKLIEQVSVLKASLGLSEEDLQWKVESARGNAFLAAERRLGECEERYDRLDYEIQQLSTTPCEEVSVTLLKKLRALVRQSSAIAEAKPALAEWQSEITQRKKDLMEVRVQVEVQLAASGGGDAENPASDAVEVQLKRVEDAKAGLLAAQEQLKSDLSRLNDMLLELTAETDNLAHACADFKFMSPEASVVSSNLVATLKGIPECSSGGERLVSLCEQAIQTTQKLKGSRAKDLKDKQQELERTIKDIEVWKTRRDSAKEFAAEMVKREQQWQEQHADDNEACLRLLRSLIPLDVHQLSVDAIIEHAEKAGGVLFTYDMATYVKHNKFLHWLVTHESDVARDNFLAIESAPFFVNFVAYDVIELRALARVLPSAFELDKDGKKAVWKAQFLEHVYTLVKQQNGDKIKAGWDPVKRARGEVQLKPLTERQMLNPVYRYPTDTEIQVRVDKFELQLKRLSQKRDKLQQLEEQQIPSVKAEYLAIAEDARSEDLQRSFGKATINKLRDAAKQQLNALSKVRDALKAEIRHAENAWNDLSPTYEQYLVEVTKIRQLDPEVRASRIRGPFPADLELKPRERAAFKKLSVEEEAQARKQELESAIAKRSQEIVDSDSAAVSGGEQQASISATAETDSGTGTAPTTENEASSASERRTSSTGETTVDSPAAKEPSEAEATPAKFQKVKSLRVAANVLRFLEQDFCSPKRIKAISSSLSSSPHAKAAASPAPSSQVVTPVRRSTPKHQVDDPAAAAAPPPTPVTPHLTRPKSKTLLLLFEKEATKNAKDESASATATPVTPHPLAAPGGRPNFLGELQRRVDSKPKPADGTDMSGGEQAASKEDESESKTLPNLCPRPVLSCPSPPRPTSFLDELKRKATVKASSEQPSDGKAQAASSTPSFLQELKFKTTASAAPTSFLDELKARASKAAGE